MVTRILKQLLDLAKTFACKLLPEPKSPGSQPSNLSAKPEDLKWAAGQELKLSYHDMGI